MKIPCVASRLEIVLGLGFALLSPPASAQTTPSKEVQSPAPAVRKLSDADAKLAEELEKSLVAAVLADQWNAAITRGEEVLVLKRQALGPKHFDTVTAEWRLKSLRRVASRPRDDQAAYRSSVTMVEEGGALYSQGKYAEAQSLFERLNAITTSRSSWATRGNTRRPNRCSRRHSRSAADS